MQVHLNAAKAAAGCRLRRLPEPVQPGASGSPRAGSIDLAGLIARPAPTGAAGLMTRIGAVDGMAVDGRGRALVTDPVLGMRSRGNDGRRSTDDDM